MTSILFVIGRTYRNQFNCNYLGNENFSDFFAAYLKSKLNVEQYEKKMTLIRYVFSKLETTKDVVH